MPYARVDIAAGGNGTILGTKGCILGPGRNAVAGCRGCASTGAPPFLIKTGTTVGFLHACVCTPPQVAPPAHAGLTAGDPVKNARALLRNALPVNNKPIRQIQLELEGISEQLRVPGSKPLGAIERVGGSCD